MSMPSVVRVMLVLFLALFPSLADARISISAYSYCKQEFGKKGARTDDCMKCVASGNNYNKVNGRWVCGLGEDRSDDNESAGSSSNDAADGDEGGGAPGAAPSGFLVGLVMLLLGALAASSFIVARVPRAADFLEKLAPVSGVLGTLGTLWGLVSLLGTLFNIRALMDGSILLALVSVLSAAVLTTTGFLLGAPWFTPFIKNEKVLARVEQARAKLEPVQQPMGLACMALAVIRAVTSFL